MEPETQRWETASLVKDSSKLAYFYSLQGFPSPFLAFSKFFILAIVSLFSSLDNTKLFKVYTSPHKNWALQDTCPESIKHMITKACQSFATMSSKMSRNHSPFTPALVFLCGCGSGTFYCNCTGNCHHPDPITHCSSSQLRQLSFITESSSVKGATLPKVTLLPVLSLKATVNLWKGCPNYGQLEAIQARGDLRGLLQLPLWMCEFSCSLCPTQFSSLTYNCSCDSLRQISASVSWNLDLILCLTPNFCHSHKYCHFN